MHEAEVGTGPSDDGRHLGIASESRDVVDEHGAGGHGGACDLGLAGVDGHGDAGGGQPRDHG